VVRAAQRADNDGLTPPSRPFTWQDGERTIRFGRGAIADAAWLLGDDYVLLTTERGAATAPGVAAQAAAVHMVPGGLVDQLAGRLLDEVEGELIVALGGGRVIDTAKALVAAGKGGRAAAIPTTLSAAEMTRVHRHAAGVDHSTPRVRPAIVINDPALSASQPDEELAASAANSLAHAVEGSVTTMASPVPTLAAREAAALISQALPEGDGPVDDAARDALALAALFAGYAIDASWYGLHHVAAQTLVREAGAGHGPANAALLPHTIGALRARRGDVFAAIDAAVGGDTAQLARRLAERAGAIRLRDLRVPESRLDACAEAASHRGELELTPPRAGEEELRALYAAAW
jgi:alcohol dehydrogenase class IV